MSPAKEARKKCRTTISQFLRQCKRNQIMVPPLGEMIAMYYREPRGSCPACCRPVDFFPVVGAEMDEVTTAYSMMLKLTGRLARLDQLLTLYPDLRAELAEEDLL
jgi:hypothetical protein